MLSIERGNEMNIFESYLAQEVFVTDIIEKVVADWKSSHKKEQFTRENLEDFFEDELIQWIFLEIETYCEAEFGEA